MHFARTHDWLASGGLDGKIDVWDVGSGVCRCRFDNQNHNVVKLRWHDTSPLLFSASAGMFGCFGGRWVVRGWSWVGGCPTQGEGGVWVFSCSWTAAEHHGWRVRAGCLHRKTNGGPLRLLLLSPPLSSLFMPRPPVHPRPCCFPASRPLRLPDLVRMPACFQTRW